MSEKFGLKWNDFHSNISNSFEILRNEAFLHDVTLVSDDYQKISAHKLVLSSCSEYFKSIFKNTTNHSQMMLCLEGVNRKDINNILDYMYNGEVQILQDDIDHFLDIAQRYQLKGLLQGQNDEPFTKQEKFETSENLQSLSPIIEDIIPEKHPHKSSTKTVTIAENDSNLETYNNSIKEAGNYIEDLEDGYFKCNICGKLTIDKKSKGLALSNMRNHIETHMEGLTYNCEVCSKTFRSKNAFNLHKSRKHRT